MERSFHPATVRFELEEALRHKLIIPVSIPLRFDLNIEENQAIPPKEVSIPLRFDLNMGLTWDGFVQGFPSRYGSI